MRVIAGYAKGNKLYSLQGTQTRPTADRVKEAVFSIIQHYISDSMVLDLFAGSGALGIEALSRGAKWCDFIDQSKSASNIIQANLQKTRLDECKIFVTDASEYLTNCEKKYDMVFLDPPYGKKLCAAAMKLIYKHGLLNDKAIIVCETSTDEEIDSPFYKIKESKYGTVKITVFENR